MPRRLDSSAGALSRPDDERGEVDEEDQEKDRQIKQDVRFAGFHRVHQVIQVADRFIDTRKRVGKAARGSRNLYSSQSFIAGPECRCLRENECSDYLNSNRSLYLAYVCMLLTGNVYHCGRLKWDTK